MVLPQVGEMPGVGGPGPSIPPCTSLTSFLPLQFSENEKPKEVTVQVVAPTGVWAVQVALRPLLGQSRRALELRYCFLGERWTRMDSPQGELCVPGVHLLSLTCMVRVVLWSLHFANSVASCCAVKWSC